MRRRKLEKLMAWACVIDIAAGVILVSGIFEGMFQLDYFKMFMMLDALWALLYYLLELRYLKIGGEGVISAAMHFTILINSTGMALISALYLGPMHASFAGSEYLALILIQDVLPVLIVLEYLVGVKHTFRKKQILYVMSFPFFYDVIALAMGALGYGFGLNGADYPYPFINVSQLGWGIVITNIGMLMIGMYLYCRLWIWLDRMWR